MTDRTRRPVRTAAAAALLALALAACDTAEERAEAHYQNAQELLAEGDVSRAMVELRSVFELNGRHRDARALMARTLLEQGELRQAFSQYLRLVEQYPNDVEARLILAELSILDDNWELAAEHADVVQEIAPDADRARIVKAAMDYRQAVVDGNAPDRREAARAAEALAERQPGSVINQTVVIDNMILEGEYEAALAALEDALETAPRERRFYRMKLSAHAQRNDDAGIEATLKEMVAAFPEDASIGQSLMEFYAARNNLDGAEAFLRDRIVPAQPDDDARVTLIRFLNDARGPEAALEEATARVEEGTNDTLFRSLRASLRYDLGQREAALDEFDTILQDAEDSEQTRELQVAYARLLDRNGNDVGARALVERVLESDPSMVGALIMRAEWLIAADLADEAINALRRAQNQEPENPQIFSTMADAHLRNGDRDLAGEMLALASDTSNRAPEETLAYARYLLDEQRYLPAESVLVEALRLSPNNVQLLGALGQTYLRLEDWSRAEQVVQALERSGADPASIIAADLRVAILRGQERNDEAIAYLETLAERDGGMREAEIAIITTHLEDGNIDEARAYLEELIARSPEDASLRFLQAAVNSAGGDLEAAEMQYRQLIEQGAANERVWLELIRVLNGQGRDEEAREALREGLDAIPEATDLLWMRATFLERQRDFEAAIEIYEELYERNSATSVIANNLASLLSTARTDDESLQRAYQIARRLSTSDFPPYQDTYGWIAYRRGNYEEALSYLRPAAEGLPDDPLVQLHLGMTLEALGRAEDAAEQLEMALEMAGDDPRPVFATARATLEELQNRDSAGGSAASDLDSLPQATPGSVTD